jgi:hypothetical protein
MSDRQKLAETVRLVFPEGLTTKEARRLADIGEALQPLGAEALVDARLYDLDEPLRCSRCDAILEAGHCYACVPVWGYRGKG